MLDDQVKGFDAISWCWGDTGALKVKKINIKGCVLSVSESAYEVLLELCIAQNKRRVWIDAVCINQDDMAERSQQVAMMSSIYERSAMTLVWLGKDNGTAERSMQMMMEIANWRQIRLGCNQQYGEFWDESTADPFPPNIDWDAVGSLFSAPWFTRLWVIQEVVLSKHVHVFWGKYQMCWRHLVQTAHYTNHNLSDEILGPGSQCGISNTVIIGKIQDRLHPLFVLASNPRLGATEPRDRVFALYGLLRDDLLGETQVELRKAFSPYYSLPLEKIYTNATKAAMCSPAGLYLLLKAQCLVNRPGWAHSDTGFPSWVPKYHFVQDEARGSYKPLLHLIERHSKRDAMKVDTDTPPNILRIAGVVVDTISEVCEQLPPPASDRSPAPCFGVRCARPRCAEYRGTVLRITGQLWHAALAANPHVPQTELAGSLRSTLQMRASHPDKHPLCDCNDDYRYAFRCLVTNFWPTEGNVPTEEVVVEQGPANFDDADLDDEYASDDDLAPPGPLPAFSRVDSHEEGGDKSLDLFWD